jgi:hypothetical protein
VDRDESIGAIAGAPERLNRVLDEAVNVHERPRFDAGLVTALHPKG